MKTKSFKKAGMMLLALVICACLFVCGMLTVRAAQRPTKTELKTGETIYSNAKASVDASNLAEGYIMVKYTGTKTVPSKVRVIKDGGTTYTYTLKDPKVEQTLPFTEGSGKYSVQVFENTSGTKYAQVYKVSLDVKLRDEMLPFLYANQYVNFKSDSAVVKKADELLKNCKTDLECVQTVFTFVTENFTYDHEKAATVQSGYLPDPDAVLAAKKGICFDYSAVMASMLRSHGIPCKLVIGYAGKEYHAWINVYIDSVGWVDQIIYFDGKNWSLMDPTFSSSTKHVANAKAYNPSSTTYSQKYAY